MTVATREKQAIRPDVRENVGRPEVRENPGHPDHQTAARYLAADDTLEYARVFLWHSVGMNELYTGTGRCMNGDGLVGDDEYLRLNGRVADIAGAVSIDLAVP